MVPDVKRLVVTPPLVFADASGDSGEDETDVRVVTPASCRVRGGATTPGPPAPSLHPRSKPERNGAGKKKASGKGKPAAKGKPSAKGKAPARGNAAGKKRATGKQKTSHTFSQSDRSDSPDEEEPQTTAGWMGRDRGHHKTNVQPGRATTGKKGAPVPHTTHVADRGAGMFLSASC